MHIHTHAHTHTCDCLSSHLSLLAIIFLVSISLGNLLFLSAWMGLSDTSSRPAINSFDTRAIVAYKLSLESRAFWKYVNVTCLFYVNARIVVCSEYTQTHVNRQTHTHTHTHICMNHMQQYIHPAMKSHIHTRARTHACTRTRTHTHTQSVIIHTSFSD